MRNGLDAWRRQAISLTFSDFSDLTRLILLLIKWNMRHDFLCNKLRLDLFLFFLCFFFFPGILLWLSELISFVLPCSFCIIMPSTIEQYLCTSCFCFVHIYSGLLLCILLSCTCRVKPLPLAPITDHIPR